MGQRAWGNERLMRMNRWQMLTMIAALVVATSGVQGQSAAPTGDRAKFIGNYKLISFDNLDEKGVSRPSQYDVGRIMYDASGQMAVQLMVSSRVKANPTTDAERLAAYRTYFAYYGGYSVDEAKGTIVHHLQGSTSPASVGTDFVRYYKFSSDGKRLTLQVKDAQGRVTGALVWERL
jgi:hypothetical protein